MAPCISNGRATAKLAKRRRVACQGASRFAQPATLSTHPGGKTWQILGYLQSVLTVCLSPAIDRRHERGSAGEADAGGAELADARAPARRDDRLSARPRLRGHHDDGRLRSRGRVA